MQLEYYWMCVCVPACVWQNAQRVSLESNAVRPVSVRTEASVTMWLGDAAAQLGGPEIGANCVSGSSVKLLITEHDDRNVKEVYFSNHCAVL